MSVYGEFMGIGGNSVGKWFIYQAERTNDGTTPPRVQDLKPRVDKGSTESIQGKLDQYNQKNHTQITLDELLKTLSESKAAGSDPTHRQFAHDLDGDNQIDIEDIESAYTEIFQDQQAGSVNHHRSRRSSGSSRKNNSGGGVQFGANCVAHYEKNGGFGEEAQPVDDSKANKQIEKENRKTREKHKKDIEKKSQKKRKEYEKDTDPKKDIPTQGPAAKYLKRWEVKRYQLSNTQGLNSFGGN